MENKLNNRYDFVFVFDVKDGNPNGDPDAGNLPRIDPETSMGLVTDVCLKRKIRNYVSLVKNNTAPYDIFIKEKAILNNLIEKSYDDESVKKVPEKEKTESARAVMCRDYYDVRTFGAVMSTGKKKNSDNESEDDKKLKKTAGQVRGPIQMTFARSVEPIFSQEHTITRMAVATEKEADKQNGDNRTMGKKFTIPYGVYCTHGFISAALANQTGFSEEDLDLFWEALANMFEHDRSAARGEMTARALVVFKHDSTLGNAAAHSLLERVKVIPIHDENSSARQWSDYKLVIDKDNMPEGVVMQQKI
ncbi:MAG: type I-C CRISPR-associated protein Cas7/Csd2 [Flavobacteriales bacterium]|nr:type I-C CRISPR-associated protein Cas7/Csd2 [Flavobacteriales bacterium]